MENGSGSQGQIHMIFRAGGATRIHEEERLFGTEHVQLRFGSAMNFFKLCGRTLMWDQVHFSPIPGPTPNMLGRR